MAFSSLFDSTGLRLKTSRRRLDQLSGQTCRLITFGQDSVYDVHSLASWSSPAQSIIVPRIKQVCLQDHLLPIVQKDHWPGKALGPEFAAGKNLKKK
jgi:hypothetical protein